MTAPHRSAPPAPRPAVPVPPGFGYQLWVAGLLGNLHDAGFAVDTCVAGQEQDDLFASHLTCQQVLQCLRVMANSAKDLPPAIQALMPGIDWPALRAMESLLAARSSRQRSALWAAMTELVPHTLRSLSRYRKQKPGLFSFRLAPWEQ
ncbi:hypothetical protein DLREEDagrD3_23840 [Denitratisoma sp. agr-D3]